MTKAGPRWTPASASNAGTATNCKSEPRQRLHPHPAARRAARPAARPGPVRRLDLTGFHRWRPPGCVVGSHPTVDFGGICFHSLRRMSSYENAFEEFCYRTVFSRRRRLDRQPGTRLRLSVPERLVRFVRAAELEPDNVELVFGFEDPRYNLALPIDERFGVRRAMAPRTSEGGAPAGSAGIHAPQFYPNDSRLSPKSGPFRGATRRMLAG